MTKIFLTSTVHRLSDAVLVVFAAALMIVSGLVHLHLWDIAYRHLATLGPLFLVQTVAALVGAFALALSRMVIVMLGSTLLMLGTIVGFTLADTVGIFGFTLPEVTAWADLALVAELLSTGALAVVMVRQAHLVQPVGPA